MTLQEIAQELGRRTGRPVEAGDLIRFIEREERLLALRGQIQEGGASLAAEEAEALMALFSERLKAGDPITRGGTVRLFREGAVRELVHTLDPELLQGLVLGRGRDAGCFINHPSVSRQHCRITRAGRGLQIEDLGSTSGTLLNGAPLKGAQTLRHNDRIALGQVELRVVFDNPEPGAKPKKSAPKPPPLPVTDREPPLQMSTVLVHGGDPDELSVRQAERHHVVILLNGKTQTIGRSQEQCDIQLPDAMVSRRHARLRRTAAGDLIEDLGSTNGVYLNGQRIAREALIRPGDLIMIGPFRLRCQRDRLVSTRKESGTRVTVKGLGKEVRERGSGKPLWLLRDISLSIQPCEFVGLMGAAGCGKSTFMDAINGRRPATHGAVYYDGQDLYKTFESIKSDIGYVPQQVILHENLPLSDVLKYSSRLRLPGDASAEEVAGNIREVLAKVGLQDRERTIVNNLSGGQKKKVTIAMELLSKPWILFFDEVTSGLDIESERQAMDLFREMSVNDKKTVVCITHFVDSLERCDMIAHFMRGRLAFYGPPGEFKEFFGVQTIRGVFQREAALSPEEWAAKYQETECYRKYVVERIQQEEREDSAVAGNAEDDSINVVAKQIKDWGAQAVHQIKQGRIEEFRRAQSVMINRWAQRIRGGHYIREFAQQFSVLRQRYVKCILADRNNLTIMLGLAPLIALLICVLSRSIYPGAGALDMNNSNDIPILQNSEGYIANAQKVMCFGGLLSAFFLALFSAIREIVKELSIYRHERFSRLLIPSYLLSKLFVLAVIGAIQALLLLGVLHGVGGLEGGRFAAQYVIFFLTSLTGLSLGLMISAAVASSDWAVNIMIAAILPQLLFAGGMAPLQRAAEKIAQYGVACYWGMQALLGGYGADSRALMNWGDKTVDNAGIIAILFHLAQVALFMAVTYLLMARKDGPGVMERLAKAIPALLGFTRRQP